VAVAGAEGANLRAALINSQGGVLNRASLFDLAEPAPGLPLRAAILAAPSTARPGPAIIRIEADGKVLGELAVSIGPRDFVSEEIALDQGNTSILADPDPQKTAESNQLWAILNYSGAEIYDPGPYSPPVSSTRRTSFFGDRRVYRYVNGSSSTSIHAGVDYGVPLGTPVSACARGRVIFARFRIVTGNSVILEHLPGVYSLYYHLSEITVTEGDMAEAGTLLGLSGSTGLSTGPHLHWEIRAAGENADPDAFTTRPVLDKDALLATINQQRFAHRQSAPEERGPEAVSY
jgi:murein DD-endopeptidase MepM/ murein hydrolase activator NlpD